MSCRDWFAKDHSGFEVSTGARSPVTSRTSSDAQSVRLSLHHAAFVSFNVSLILRVTSNRDGEASTTETNQHELSRLLRYLPQGAGSCLASRR